MAEPVTSRNIHVLGAQDEAKEMSLVSRAYKRVVVKPGPYGVVTLPPGFVADGDMDPQTGFCAGWVPDGQ